jgi:hypothetical protein
VFRSPDVNSYSDFAGVLGTGVYVTGVAGTSVNNVGVYGQAGEATERSSIPEDASAGVLGASITQPGVVGYSEKHAGVIGVSHEEVAVFAVSDLRSAVLARSSWDSGVRGGSGNTGSTSVFNVPTTAGVPGSSNEQAGVIGTSSRTAGVLGFSNNVGVYGATTNPAGNYAGVFRATSSSPARSRSACRPSRCCSPTVRSACSIAWRARSFGSRISARRSSSADASSSTGRRAGCDTNERWKRTRQAPLRFDGARARLSGTAHLGRPTPYNRAPPRFAKRP